MLRSRALLRHAADDAPVTCDSKIDKFDERKELILRKAGRYRTDIDPDEVRDTSLYEFWWTYTKDRRGHGVRSTHLSEQSELLVLSTSQRATRPLISRLKQMRLSARL